MASARNLVYLTNPEYLITVFNLREPGATEMLDRERATWPEHTAIEVLDQVHLAAIRRPGWVGKPGAPCQREGGGRP
jgi:hypothetical protein